MEPASNGAAESYNTDLPDTAPERWETAIEDFVQLVALAIDRAQDLADVVNDLLRGHPELVRAALAATAGGVVGAVLADRIGRKPEPIREVISERTMSRAARAAERGSAILGATAAGLRGSAEQWVRRAPPPEEIRDRAWRRMPRIDAIGRRLSSLDAFGLPIARRGSDGPPVSPRQAAQLVPIAVTLLKNPIVRDIIIRSALRAARSRYR
jgi:hypothetical protein